jgi:hypothetical protein
MRYTMNAMSFRAIQLLLFGPAAAAVRSQVPDAWHSRGTSGAPSGRTGHTAVWTGHAMFVWGGGDTAGPLSNGESYYPQDDTWVREGHAFDSRPLRFHCPVSPRELNLLLEAGLINKHRNAAIGIAAYSSEPLLPAGNRPMASLSGYQLVPRPRKSRNRPVPWTAGTAPFSPSCKMRRWN